MPCYFKQQSLRQSLKQNTARSLIYLESSLDIFEAGSQFDMYLSLNNFNILITLFS